MFGKSNFSIWVEKFGEEIALQKLKEKGEKASKSLKGKKRDEKALENIRKAAKNRKKPEKKMCIYCNKLLDPGNYAQHHGEKCKFKK